MGVLVAVLIVSAQLSFPVSFTPVPITFQTLAIMFICAVLKPLPATLTVLSYISMGAMGVPVFSGWQNGWVAFTQHTAGFIVGFVPITIFMSICVQAIEKRYSKMAAGGVCRYNITPKRCVTKKYLLLTLVIIGFTIILYAFGAIWLYIFIRYIAATNVNLTFGATLMTAAVPFLLGDSIMAAAFLMCYERIVGLGER